VTGIFGPLAMTVVDGFGDGAGQLRASLLGIRLQTASGLLRGLAAAGQRRTAIPAANARPEHETVETAGRGL
jgi:hypothetical protein